jgi:hypothetical protein
MDDLLGITPRRGRIDFSLEDVDQYARNMFFLDGYPGTTMVSISRRGPGATEPAHAHGCDYLALILEGSYEVGRRVYRPGDFRIQEAGSVYGPSRAGPDGCVQMVVFANPAGMVLDLARERDRDSGQYDDMNAWLARIGAGAREQFVARSDNGGANSP